MIVDFVRSFQIILTMGILVLLAMVVLLLPYWQFCLLFAKFSGSRRRGEVGEEVGGCGGH